MNCLKKQMSYSQLPSDVTLVRVMLLSASVRGVVSHHAIWVVNLSASARGEVSHHAVWVIKLIASAVCFSGQSAALAGGTTLHIDFILPVEHDLLRGLEAWKVCGNASYFDVTQNFSSSFAVSRNIYRSRSIK